MLWARPLKSACALRRTFKGRVKMETISPGLVTITKINSFTADLEGRKRVKLVVSLELTADGRKRIDQELNV